jgi:hypothetical protein
MFPPDGIAVGRKGQPVDPVVLNPGQDPTLVPEITVLTSKEAQTYITEAVSTYDQQRRLHAAPQIEYRNKARYFGWNSTWSA